MTKGNALGGGLILSPEHGCGLPGRRLQDRVSLLDTLDATKRLTCGGVIPELDGYFHRMVDSTVSSSACAE